MSWRNIEIRHRGESPLGTLRAKRAKFRKGGNHVNCRDIFTTEKTLVVVNRIEPFGNFSNSRKVGVSLKSRKPSGFKGDSGAIRADAGSQNARGSVRPYGEVSDRRELTSG